MINANTAFREQTKKVNYIDITLRDGTVLNLEPSDLALGQFSMKDETTTGKFCVGSAISKTVSLTIANHTDKFSMYDFYKAIMHVYVSVTLEDGTILKERKGKYYVIEPSTTGEVINLSGIDSMYLFDKPYNASTVYPATLQSILTDCCLDCGVSIGFRQFDNYNFIVEKRPEECTYREVVSWVAQIAGYNARISNDDVLELVWHEMKTEDVLNGGMLYMYNEEDSYDGGNFTEYENVVLWDGGNFFDSSSDKITRIKSLKVGTDDVVITGVKVNNGDVSVLVGEESYCVTIQENSLALGKENEVAQYLGNKLIGLQFRPLTCEIPNNPLYEPFDSCHVYDRKGNSYFALINSVSYSINGFTTIACKAEDPIRNESSYTSESAKAIVKAKRETSNILTTYDKAVQNMNMLAANAMGLYRESEIQSDNSSIYYQSNRPITKGEDGKCEFVEDSVVYKMTSDGFFVSEDGGITYTSGFDANGNAVVNVLSAIGITFDWAKGGTITLGGDNNTNGSMNVLDAEGNVIGKFNKDGLWAKNGYFEGDIVSTNAEITGGYINIETAREDFSCINLQYGTKNIEMSPIRIQAGGDYGVSLTGEYICLGSTSSSYYVWLDREKIMIPSTLGSTTISKEGIKAIDSNYYQQGGKFELSTTDLKIYSSTLGTYGIETSKNVKFTGYNYIYGTTYIGNTTYDSLEVKATTKFTGGVTFNGSVSFGSSTSMTIDGTFQTKGTTKLCDGTYDTLSFFGGSGSTKKTVSTIYSTTSATASSNATKINEIINALKDYNLL